MTEHEITTTDFMLYVVRRISAGLVSASPDEQLDAQNDFRQHAGQLSASEYIEFADAVRMQVALLRAQEGQS
jgi:hypothetical protein